MRRINAIIIILLAMVIAWPTDCYAQKNKKRKKKPEPVVVEEEPEPTPAELLYQELLPSTAKVMFVDSLVVPKDSFLNYIPFAPEFGSVKKEGKSVVYTNGFGYEKLIADSSTAPGQHIYSTKRFGESWTEPEKLKELEEVVSNPNYPFMMADGVTLFFSAEGDESIGGTDIFMTSFNTSTGKFYKPENYGMPFNSTANEYLLVISDFDQLGWLVSDRYQPEGKVCIYMFEPISERRGFDESTDEETIKAFAGLSSIKNTWKFGNRKEVIERHANLMTRRTDGRSYTDSEVVINDKTVWRNISEVPDKYKKQYSEITKDKERLASLSQLLSISRKSYSDASKSSKDPTLAKQIMQLENDVLELEQIIKKTEKELRNIINK